MAYADATITSGTDVLLDLLNFDKIIDDANLVMTSVKALLGAFEGHGDGQRTSGGISAKDGLGGIVLGKGGVLVGHHHAMRAARCDGRAIALDVVGATQQCEHHIFIAGGKFRRHFHRRGIGACGSDQY